MHYDEAFLQELKDRTDLVELARYMGYTPKKIGSVYTLQEHDSLRIYHHNTFCRHSTKVGGDAITFIQYMGDYGFQEAVQLLIDFTNLHPNMDVRQMRKEQPVESDKELELPPKATSYRRAFAYLIKTRCIAPEIVDYCVKNHLLYESDPHHNVVFLSRDKDGVVRHAFMRGTNDSVPFKGDVPGNDKNFGFNIPVPGSNRVKVFEAAIDLLSEWTMTIQESQVHRLALGMLFDAPLETYLKEHPEITHIDLCLDADVPGKNAAEELKAKYKSRGYEVSIQPPAQGKDYNESLKMKCASTGLQTNRKVHTAGR
ncbi:MAG: DUF3991 domain-containing protein [Lachnospiraceae bacterium]|nr:DUF3991 domain-containing protein [Lachnospiraceae bacterium]